MPRLSDLFWNKLRKLDAKGWPRTTAFIASRVCRDRKFSVDADGDRINRQADITIVCRDLMPSRRLCLENHVRDNWLYAYHPKAGDVVLDIGAGIGEEMMILAPQVKRMVCVEASDEVFRCLEKNIAANRLDNVTPLKCAISDRDGELRMTDTADHRTNHFVNEGGVVVPTKTIESLCRSLGIDQIDFLKMNIEGAEKTAVQGFGDIDIRHLVISCHNFLEGEQFQTHDFVKAHLRDAGYNVLTRPHHPLPWTRCNIYASKE